jgi:ParB family transcriptional regulator, chromosome partitioning protein
MSEKRRALGRGLGALIPSSPGTARPVDVLFRDSSPPPSPDGAEPGTDAEEHANGYGHDTSLETSGNAPRDKAFPESPVPHEEPIDVGEGSQAPTGNGEARTDAAERSAHPAEARTGVAEARTDVGELNDRGVPQPHRAPDDHSDGGHPDAGSDHRVNESGDGLSQWDDPRPAHHAAAIGDGQDNAAKLRAVGNDTIASNGARDAHMGATSEAELAPVPGATFAILPIAAIRPNPRQPRTVFDEDELAELAASIREIGVLQPVVVRPIARGERDAVEQQERDGAEHHERGDFEHQERVGVEDHAAESLDGPQPGNGVQPEREAGSPDVGPRFELIMGERRLRASQLAGLDTIPAIVKETHDDDLLRDALLENLHRTQLNPLEEAAAYQQLLDDFGCSHDELASRIGRSRPQISNTIRLLRLPPLVARRLAAGVLSAGHARALLGLDDAAAMERLAQRIVAEGLSVRSVEEIVALGGDDPAAVPKARRPRAGTRHPQLDDLAARLSDRYDTRVTIALGQRKGRLTVEFASVEDLNRIVGLMERI